MRFLADDLRDAFRQFRERPYFALSAIAVLAVGMGATVCLFTLLNALVLRRLPVPEPDRLVSVSSVDRNGQLGVLSVAMFRGLQDRASAFTRVAGYVGTGLAIVELGSDVVPAGVDAVTSEYFSVLGLRPSLGRFFTGPDVDLDGSTEAASRVVVLSHRFWTTHCGADPHIVGRLLRIQGVTFTVIGVGPQAFTGLQVGAGADLTVPLTTLPQLVGVPIDKGDLWVGQAIGRLKEGHTADQAQAQIRGMWSALLATTVPAPSGPDERQAFLARRSVVQSGENGFSTLRDRYNRPLLIVLGLSVWMLVISCANLGGLLMVRTAARASELAVRRALGASVTRLIRPLVCYSVTLSLAGAALSVPIAWFGAWLFVEAMNTSTPLPLTLDLAPDPRVLAVAALVGVVTGVLCAVAPAWVMATDRTRPDSRGDRTVTSAGGRLVHALVVLQVAFCCSTLVIAAVLGSSLVELLRMHDQFRTRRALVAQLVPQPAAAPTTDPTAYPRSLLRQLSAVGGVDAAALSDSMPIPGVAVRAQAVAATTEAGLPGDQGMSASVSAVTPGFFATLDIPVLRGRDFTWQDGTSPVLAAIVTRSLADAAFAGSQAIGRRIRIGTDPRQMEIVGVVADAPLDDVRDPRPRKVILPYNSEVRAAPVALVRTRGDSPAYVTSVRNTIRSAGRDYALHMQPLDDWLGVVLFPERAASSLAVFFGALGTLLVAIGIYSFIHYQVVRRTREMAVRLALGATPASIRARWLWLAIRLAVLGTALGLPVGLALSTFAGDLAFEMGDSRYPLLTALTAALLLVTAIVAGSVPSRRASRLDVIAALRGD
jgi:predicted permease